MNPSYQSAPMMGPTNPSPQGQAPKMSGNYNPNEQVVITNNKTNQIKQVRRADLPSYGLPIDYQSQANIKAQSIMNGNAPAQNADAATQLILNQNNYKDPNSAQAKAAQAKTDAYGKVKSSIQNQLDMYSQLPGYDKGQILNVNNVPFLQGATQGGEYEKQKQALGATLKEVAGAGQGSGVRVTQSELNNWSNLLPGIHKSDAQNKQDITLLDKQLKSSFGQGLDPEYLKQFGVNSQGGLTPKPGATPADSTTPSVGGFIQNAGNDAKNLVNGVLNIPATAIKGVQSEIKQGNYLPQQWGNDAGATILKSYADSLNKDAGQPLQGGDILGRIAQNAYQRPVSTAADVLPFLKAGKAGAVGDTTEGLKFANGTPATVGPQAPNIVQKMAGGIQKGAENAAEVVGGGGTKDLIAKNVNMDQARSLSKTLLDKGILNNVTTKGRIEATTRGLVDEGQNINKALSGSPVTYNSADLAKEAGQYLNDKYGSTHDPVINDVINNMAKGGKFDLTTGNQTLTPVDLNNAKTGLYDYGLRQLGMGESGKIYSTMAKDLASFLRTKLSTDIPEATPALREYGNLRTYLDDVLQNPKGMNVQGGIIKNATGLAREGIEKGLQNVYNAAGKVLPDNPSQVNFSQSSGLGATPQDAISTPSQVDVNKPTLTLPYAKPTEDAVLQQIVNGKGAAQSNRLLRDHRTTGFTLRPSDERKYAQRVIQVSASKRYR